MERCQQCNTELRAKARFCPECGFSPVDIGASPSLSSSDAPESLPQSHPASEPASPSETPQPTIVPEAPQLTTLPETPQPSAECAISEPPSPSETPETTIMERCQQCNTELRAKARFCPECGFSPVDIGASPSLSLPDAPESLPQSTPASEPASPSETPQPTIVPETPKPLLVPATSESTIATPAQQSTVAPVQLTRDHAASTGNLDPLPTDYIPLEDIKSQLNLNGTHTSLGSSPESFAASSRMAERWRSSWRDRQRAEAGSAEGVSRGQASVAMPLMATQNSLSRRRATVSNNQKRSGRNTELGFWITVFLVVCLVGGLGVHIISTSLPNSVSDAAHAVPPSATAQPALSLQGPQSATIKQGQILLLHGEHFVANDTITFLLDGTTPIKDENGKVISVQASNAERFDVSIPIQASDWSADSHYIQAMDGRTKESAYLNIGVSPASTPETTSPNLALSIQGKPAKKLTFHAVAGQGNPNQQRVTLTNTSGSPLHWTATANAVDNLSWLLIDDNQTAGNLNISGIDSIGISVFTIALKSNPPTKPYTGQIVFTIKGQEQLTLPVELQVTDPQSEIVFSPNPAVAPLGAGKTCQLTPLTLINLGNSFISWTLVPYYHNKDRIQFMANGQPMTQGMLAPSGESGDTQLLNVQCNGVSVGDTYKFTMYAGNASWLVTIVTT